MYLGMHSLPDILGGLVIGIVLLFAWVTIGFSALDEWIEHGTYGKIILFKISFFLKLFFF